MEKFYQNLINILENNNKYSYSLKNLKKFYLTFGFLKIIDSSLKYSKEDVMKTYEKNKNSTELKSLLYKKAIYPNGKELGFYNISNFDLEKLCENNENIHENFQNYLNGFSSNIKEVFDNFELDEIISEYFSSHQILFTIINKLNNLKLNKNKFNTPNQLFITYEYLIDKYYSHDKRIYNYGTLLNNFSDFLVEILFSDVEFENKNEITIFDPVCRDGDLLFTAKNYINKKYPNCKVHLVGQELKNINYAICLSKMIIYNDKFSRIKKVSNSEESYQKIESGKFDFIISNSMILALRSFKCDALPHSAINSFLKNYLLNEHGNISKMVLTLPTFILNDISKNLNELISLDILESVINLPLKMYSRYNDLFYSVLVLNYNKKDYRKNYILLIDEIENITYSEKFYETTIFTDNLYNTVIKSYKKFQEYNNSNIIKVNTINNDFNFNRLMLAKKISFNKKMKIYYLGEICDLKYCSIRNNKDDTLLIKNSKKELKNKFIYFNDEVNNYQFYKYLECKLKTENILLEYLYIFLNSTKGKYQFNYFSRDDPNLEIETLKYLYIPIPDIKTQKEIIKTQKEFDEFFSSIKLLNNKFKNNLLEYEEISRDIEEFKGVIELSKEGYNIVKMNKNWRDIYGELLWPLTITYLTATKGNFETTEKANNYKKLFEFIAAFNCVILISGLPKKFYQKNKDDIWNMKDSTYHQMTFGNWVHLCKNLGEIYRKNVISTPIEYELFTEISNDKILKILFKINKIRNMDAHGPITNIHEAEELINELEPYLKDTFEILKFYENFKLYYIPGECKTINKNLIQYKVMSLNGPCNQPIYLEKEFNEILEAETLYLYDSINNKFLKIKDNLMKFKLTDINRNFWSLFLFTGTEKRENNNIKAKYSCFQHTEKDIYTDIESFSKDIKN